VVHRWSFHTNESDDRGQVQTQGANADTSTALTVDEIAALFGIPVTVVRERLARRAVPQEYFSIPDLAKAVALLAGYGV
jgi:hypothetical protein